MKKSAPINIIVHAPRTPQRTKELSIRVAHVHSETIIRRIQQLNIPTSEKLKLTNAIINHVKNSM